jgi:hypothetical protein
VRPVALAVAVAAGLAGVAGCGDGTVPVDAAAGATVEPFECPAGADCNDAVVVDGRDFEVTCAVADERALGQVVAGAGGDPRFTEARAVAGEPPELVVALHRRTAQPSCGAGAAWTVAVAAVPVDDAAGARIQGRIRCLVPAQPDDHRCPAGGPFTWHAAGDAEDESHWEWLDEVVAGVNADLAAGESVPEHASPVGTVAAEVTPAPPHELYDDQVLQRIGVEEVASGGGVAEVLVVYQEGLVYGDIGLAWSTQEERYTVEQLLGGPGWWITGFEVESYADPVAGDAGRAAIDERWAACCDAVVLDLAA